MQGAYERGQTHGAREDEMAQHPGGEQIRFESVHRLDHLFEIWGRARREFLFFVLGGVDHPWHEDGGSKGDYGKYYKTETSDAADFSHLIGRLFEVFGGRIAKISFPNPCRTIEKEGEPA